MVDRQHFLDLGEKITELIQEDTLGSFLAGSIVHKKDEYITSKSDLDYVVVSWTVDFLSKIPEFADLVPHDFEPVDGFTLHNFVNGIEVSIVIYTPDAFLKLCSLDTDPLKIWRNNIGPGQYSNKVSAAGYTLRDFAGKEYAWQQGIEQVEDGFIIDYYPAQYIEGQFILGSYPQNCLNRPRINHDNGIIAEGIERVWTAFAGAYLEARQKGDANFNHRNDILNIIYDSDKMMDEVRSHIVETFWEHV